MTTELVKREGRGSATRPPTGLLLSIGDKAVSRGGKEIPTRIDYFRPKEGQLEQYSLAVARFHEVYGERPKSLDDLYFLSNEPASVLDIRLMAWGSSGIRVRGNTNFAALGEDAWEEAAFAFVDDVTFYPVAADELPAKWRPKWKGQPIPNQAIDGPDHAWVGKYQINVEATLTFLLPKVMGIGTVAQITTKSKRSMRNLVSSIYKQREFYEGHLIGPPFRLTVRPARTHRYDDKTKKKVPVDFFELVLDSAMTVGEVMEIVQRRREALGAGQPGLGSPEARALTQALQLPAGAPVDEVQLRDEPHANVDRADDATLNRIAQLEDQVGVDAALVTLRGVFGVETAGALGVEDAARYEQILGRSAGVEEPAEFVDPEDVEF